MGALEWLVWGAFLGVALLLMSAALIVYAWAKVKAGLEFALGAAVSVAYVLMYLGLNNLDNTVPQDRALATFGLGSAAFLGLLLTRLLRVEHSERRLRLASYVLVAMGSVALVASFALSDQAALRLAGVVVTACAFFAVLVCLLAQWYGDRLAGLIAGACMSLAVAVCGLAWLALHRGVELGWLHALSALASSIYLALLATGSTLRYQYRLEMRMAMRDRQSFDPLTRMSSSAGTAKLLHAALKHAQEIHTPIGVMSITLSNLRALEDLHGLDFVNRALYALAWRLRSSSSGAEVVGRIGDDSFLIIAGRLTDAQRFARRGPRLVDELRRPISLGAVTLSGGSTVIEWQAEVGVGVLWVDDEQLDVGRVLSMARSLAISALSFNSRVARFDASHTNIVEFTLGARA